MRALAREIDGLELPAVEKISESSQEDPFQVLIGTLLSARTQDATTAAASERLFAVARTPKTMAALTVKQIERLIYPVSFYRHKARHVKATCRILVDTFGGRVPATMEELLTLPGVGSKTANLVLILAFKSVKNICVDTHVHRISNRLGWVKTATPDETEQALYEATRRTMVADHQPVSGDVGPERVPAGLSALRRVRDRGWCPRIGVARTRRGDEPPDDARLVLAIARSRGRQPARALPAAAAVPVVSSRRRKALCVRDLSRAKRRKPLRTSFNSSETASTTASDSIARCRASSCSGAIRSRAISRRRPTGAGAMRRRAARRSARPK